MLLYNTPTLRSQSHKNPNILTSFTMETHTMPQMQKKNNQPRRNQQKNRNQKSTQKDAATKQSNIQEPQ